MKLFIQFTFLLFMTPFMSNAQTSGTDLQAIIGRWEMIKMDVLNGPYFDVADPVTSYKRFLALVEARSNYDPGNSAAREMSREDSVAYKADFDSAFNSFRQLFVEFKTPDTYITNQSGSEDISRIMLGTFSLDTTLKIVTTFEKSKKTRRMYYQLAGGLLTLSAVEPENKGSFIVFKKSQ